MICSYGVDACKQQLCDIAVNSLHGQICLGQEVGKVVALHFFAIAFFRCFPQALVNVAFSWKSSTKAQHVNDLEHYEDT